MPGWGMSENFEKPKMAEPGKKFKVSNSETTEWKNQKLIQSSDWLRYFQTFPEYFHSTLKSMAIQCIHMVFEKEMVESQVFFHK